ncbi:MAG: hypothetical protein C4523_02945 [Myxococcales bacterium]|nr:MAG: hypothetical protein C4523_02945 [Myxococcales bacterium]
MKRNGSTNIHCRLGGLLARIVLAGALIFSGCANDSLASNADFTPTPDGDAEADGEMEGDASGRVAIELIPPADTGYLTQQLLIDNLADFDGRIVLRRAYSYTGEVQGPDGKAAEASLSFALADREEVIPSHPLARTIVATSEPQGRDGKAEFVARLLPGVYTAYVFPRDEKLAPPIVLHDELEIVEDSFRIFRFEDGIAVNGILSYADGLPVKDARVSAYDSEVYKRSSVALTNHLGQFTLLFSRLDGIYDVVVEASEYNPFVPRLATSKAARVIGGQLIWLNPVDDEDNLLLQFQAYSQATCLLSGIVYGETPEGGDPQPVASAKLSFSATKIGGGSFGATAVADEAGRYSVELIRTELDVAADNYQVRVQPPVESDSASAQEFGLECSSETAGRNFQLPARIAVAGAVTDDSGEPISGVEVQAHRRPADPEAIAYVKSVFTDEEGLFRLTIDAGLHDFVFLPPAGSDLARAALRDIETTTGGTVDQTLHAGKRFIGEVVDPDGNPMPWVYLEIYRLRPSSGTAESIGWGASDESGQFQVMIP